jgi:glycerol-3-phosphate dehydrogenase (NAD(P)+)
MIGLAGTGDLVATALAPESRNRRAGELLAQGVPSSEIPPRVGQAVEALESVPLLARALTAAGIEAPVTRALARLIEGELPLDDWVAVVRATVPPPARWRPQVRPGFWRRLRERIRTLFTRRRKKRHQMFTNPEVGNATLGGGGQQVGGDDATDHRDGGSAD